MKTPQELFDFAVPKVLSQTEMSKSASGCCIYRKRKDLRCAIGWLLPDEYYDKIYEGSSVATLISKYYKKLPEEFCIENETFLTKLQHCYDNAAFDLSIAPDDFARFQRILARNLKLLAYTYKLSMPKELKEHENA